MKPVFISYRRKDTADIAGRLFDRLAGYFGPENTLLDVDALVSGASYRTQIEQLIGRCGVVLAIIGREWLSVVDETGRRRLDNPEDQLRLEIAVALRSGRTVIPVLVHDAAMPTADDLPDELKPLADCVPHTLQSGTPFNADVQFLYERLQELGLHPPESTFPWQFVLLPVGIGVLLFGIGVALLAAFEHDNDFVLQQLDPGAPLATLRTLYESEQERYGDQILNLARFDLRALRAALLIALPLGLGPMIVVWGKRRCCLNKEVQSARMYAYGARRAPRPKSGKAIVCLALGLASMAWGPLTAIPALLLGAVAWREIRRHPTWIRGRSLIVVGMAASLIGLAIFYFYHWDQWRLRSWIAAMEHGFRQAEAGDLDGALETFGDAAERAPRNELAKPVCRMQQGQILLTQERAAEALPLLTAAIDALETGNPAFPTGAEMTILSTAYADRAAVYDALGQTEAAAKDREQDPRPPLEGVDAPMDFEAPSAPAAPLDNGMESEGAEADGAGDESDDAPMAPPAPAPAPAADSET